MQLVLIGGSGDLARRMLLPALYHLDRDGLLAADLRVTAVARHDYGREAYVEEARAAILERDPGAFDPPAWRRFADRLDYLAGDLRDPEVAAALGVRLDGQETVFYLAVSPSLYEGVCAALAAAGLTGAPNRVVLEKPIGRDAASSDAINTAVARAFSEARTYRIDHYLGKETVQNLIALRFANTLFEPLWNSLSIDHVQITVAETEGVGERWPYYDDYGALRDMLQNHVLQLLCLVAMEPPATLDPDSVRTEKVKVVRCLRRFDRREGAERVVRGQYAGLGGDGPSPSYAEECGRPGDTETFVALRTYVDNWRWAGVPFYLRTGKRMARKRTHIVIQFKPTPHSIFGAAASRELVANRLVIDLQPDEDISLLLMNKTPGLSEDGFSLSPLSLRLSLSRAFGGERRRIAYERLLLDVFKNNSTLFVRRDEIEASWAWIDGLREVWDDAGQAVSPYPNGSWGPAEAAALMVSPEHHWHD